MNQDEIIRMAREAGLHLATDVNWMPIIGLEYAEKFAALVIAAEREAIAKMIEDAPELVPLAKNDQGGCVICGFDPKFAAAFIRARGNT